MVLASIQQPLEPNPTELVIGLITFAIIFAGLWKVLLPRMQKILAERTDRIEGGLRRAEETQVKASEMREQYRARLAAARYDAARIREQAKEEAAQIVAQCRGEGAAQRQRRIESAASRIDADHRQVINALRAEVGTFALELASKIVGESLADDPRFHDRGGFVSRADS